MGVEHNQWLLPKETTILEKAQYDVDYCACFEFIWIDQEDITNESDKQYSSDIESASLLYPSIGERFDFGEAIKWTSVLHGEHCVEALKHLLSDSYAMRKASKPWDIAGSWAGNSIVLTGDDSSPPDPIGIEASSDDDPDRNLNQLAAAEFQNISNLAIAMLAEHGYEKQILDHAENDNCLFLTIADFITQTSDSRLKAAFEYRFKTNWRKRYNEIVAERTWHKPISVPTKT